MVLKNNKNYTKPKYDNLITNLMKAKIYYIAFLICFCATILSFVKQLPAIGYLAFAMSFYFLLKAFFENNNPNNPNNKTT